MRSRRRVSLGPKELEAMERAGRLAAATLRFVAERLEPGMTTATIDRIVHEHTLANRGVPATLGYKGYPASCCTSVNEVVCHGIPGDRQLREGDIVNVDVTTVLDGWYGDTSATFYVGEPSAEARYVTEVSRWCLELGIAAVRPGGTLGDIGHAIQTYAESKGCSVVRDYCGHGIHRVFHDEPSVPHYGTPGTGLRLRPGMTFTIEPMINVGRWEIEHLDDGWTVVSRDRSLSAQFEHTVAVTEEGCRVLTRREGPLPHSEDRPYSRIGPLSCWRPSQPAAAESFV